MRIVLWSYESIKDHESTASPLIRRRHDNATHSSTAQHQHSSIDSTASPLIHQQHISITCGSTTRTPARHRATTHPSPDSGFGVEHTPSASRPRFNSKLSDSFRDHSPQPVHHIRPRSQSQHSIAYYLTSLDTNEIHHDRATYLYVFKHAVLKHVSDACSLGTELSYWSLAPALELYHPAIKAVVLQDHLL